MHRMRPKRHLPRHLMRPLRKHRQPPIRLLPHQRPRLIRPQPHLPALARKIRPKLMQPRILHIVPNVRSNRAPADPRRRSPNRPLQPATFMPQTMRLRRSGLREAKLLPADMANRQRILPIHLPRQRAQHPARIAASSDSGLSLRANLDLQCHSRTHFTHQASRITHQIGCICW